MTKKAKVFEDILNDYLEKVASIKARDHIRAQLGISVNDEAFEIPFFNRTYTVTPKGITDEHRGHANHAVAVILCKYLLSCPQNAEKNDSLATYKDFRDAAPYVIGFRNTAERPIARAFSGDTTLFEERCRRLQAQRFETEVSCDLAFQFVALPRIPVFLLFNDMDEEFSAGCTLLFRKDAATYLDMECIAMIGSALAEWLQRA